jgi:hypothetical protein
MDKVIKLLAAAAASSVATVCMLLTFALKASKEAKMDVGTVILLPIGVLLLTVAAIVAWVRCCRRYVDWEIEKKSSERDKEGKD